MNHFKKIISIALIIFSYWSMAQCPTDIDVTFTFNSDNNESPCANQELQFTSQISGGNNSFIYLWDFDDGNTSNQPNPTYSFQAIGGDTTIYNVKLTVMSTDSVCSWQHSENISIRQLPEIKLIDSDGFEISKFDSCGHERAGLTIQFSDNSQTGSDWYQVDWGDLSDSYESNSPPTNHTYTSLGLYDITYLIVGPNDCTNTRTYRVLNISNPGAGLGTDPGTKGCAPASFPIYISNFEQNHSSTIYTFNPGDGSGDSIFTIPTSEFIHTWNRTSCGEPNNRFNISLTVTNECDETSYNSRVIEVYEPPNAAIELLGNTVCAGSSLTFNNVSTDNSSACSEATRYTWDFGDGQKTELMDNRNSVSHTYETAGTYTVTLTTSSRGSCGSVNSSTDAEIVVCNETPLSSFNASYNISTVSSTTDCSSNAIEFDFGSSPACPTLSVALINNSNTPCNGFLTWEIEGIGATFSNGLTSSNNYNEEITFNTGGLFTVKLNAENICGLSESCILFNIQELPGSTSHAISLDPKCAGDSISLEVNEIDSTYAYSWNIFGTDTTSTPSIPIDLTNANPENFLLPTGSYIGVLSMWSACGSTQDSVEILVFPPPDLSVSPSSIELCLGENVEISASGATSFKWSPSSTLNRSEGPVVLAQPDTTTVYTVVGFNGTGCTDTTQVIIRVANLPTAYAGSDQKTCISANQILLDSLPGVSPLNGIWEGNGIENRIFNPSLAGIGSHTLHYRIGDNDSGCSGSDQLIIEVFSDPVASFSNPDSACLGQSIIFENNTSSESGNTYTYSWFFGDGDSSQLINPTKEYLSSGNFDVSLLVNSEAGCIALVQNSIAIRQPPSASFFINAPNLLCDSSRVIIVDNSEGDDLDYLWNFGNGIISSNSVPDTLFFRASKFRDTTYSIHLTISSANNICPSSSFSTSISLAPSPSANFLFQQPICSDSAATINNSSYGEANTFTWYFGDGSVPLVSLENSILHTFSNPGVADTTFIISLTAQNECGVDSLALPLTISPKSINAFFVADKLQECQNVPLNFISNQTYGNGNEIWWSMGDGHHYQGIPSFSHMYDSAGTYYPVLIIRNGCDVDTCNTYKNPNCGASIRVLESPTAEFYAPDSTCLGESIHLLNQSTGVMNSYWHLGNEDSSFQFNPDIFTYDSAGIYSVSLLIQGFNQCYSDISTNIIKVIETPNASFYLNDRILCEGESALMTNDSRNASSFKWTADNGFISYQLSDTILFNTQGEHKISLQAFSHQEQQGCLDSVSHTVTLIELPEPEFHFETISECGATTVNFINDTENSNSSHLNFLWDIDINETPLTDFSPTWVFQSPTQSDEIRNVILTVTNNLGCTDSTSHTLLLEKYQEKFKLPPDNQMICITPNRPDNRIFKILAENLDEDSFSMKIYNQWGNMVFQSNDYNEGWNGYYKGSKASNGTYIAKVSFNGCQSGKLITEYITVCLIE